MVCNIIIMAQPLTRKLSKEDIERITNGVVSHLKESFDNPFTMPDFLRNSPLMEGYFKTYPTDKIVKYLQKRYGEYASIEVMENENGVEVFIISFYDDKDSENVINRDMALCGYFPSISHNTGNIKYIQYEPRHQNHINDIVQDVEYIYHLTPSNKINKILKNGLTPRTNNKLFKYPDRIYFFLNEPCYEELQEIMKQFYNEDLKKAKENKNYIPYTDAYTLLAIDTEMIKNCNFYYDPNLFDAIYTKDNILAQAINIVDEFEQEYLNKK